MSKLVEQVDLVELVKVAFCKASFPGTKDDPWRCCQDGGKAPCAKDGFEDGAKAAIKGLLKEFTLSSDFFVEGSKDHEFYWISKDKVDASLGGIG